MYHNEKLPTMFRQTKRANLKNSEKSKKTLSGVNLPLSSLHFLGV